MKLFLWREVLSDYTHGVMFALAEDVEQARSLIKAKYEGDGNGTLYELAREPEVFSEPFGFYLHGGG